MCKRERERINMVSDTNMNCNWYEIKGERERECERLEGGRKKEKERKRSGFFLMRVASL